MTLTEFAREGYEGKPNQHLPSSPVFYAHALGEFFRVTGRCTPVHVAMGRGYTIRANDMKFSISNDNTFTRIE